MEDFALVGNFALPLIKAAVLPLSKSRTTKYLESSWHLFTSLISAIISSPDLNYQENVPSGFALVPNDNKIIIKIIRIKVSNFGDGINNGKNYSMLLVQN